MKVGRRKSTRKLNEGEKQRIYISESNPGTDEFEVNKTKCQKRNQIETKFKSTKLSK